MKFWKALGGVLCFLGCLAALAGILATAAPMIDNNQVRRILDSFAVASPDPVLNAANGVFLLCLRQNYLVFAVGAALLLVGGLMKTAAARALYRAGEASEARQTTATRSRTTAPSAETSARKQAPAPKAEEYRPTAAVSATAPAPASAAAGMSPYAAAAYEKALSGDAGRSSGSDIARKYKPGSIIATEDAQPEESAALGRPVSAPAREELSQPAATTAQPTAGATGNADAMDGAMICPACGGSNPARVTYCNHCGSRLTSPQAFMPEEGATPAYSRWDAPPIPTGAGNAALFSETEPAGESLTGYTPYVSLPPQESAQAQENFSAEAAEGSVFLPPEIPDATAPGTQRSQPTYSLWESVAPAQGANAKPADEPWRETHAPTQFHLPETAQLVSPEQEEDAASRIREQVKAETAETHRRMRRAWTDPRLASGTPTGAVPTTVTLTPSGAAAAPAGSTAPAGEKPRPRIVSTMGKKSTR